MTRRRRILGAGIVTLACGLAAVGLLWVRFTGGRTRWQPLRIWSAWCANEPPGRLSAFQSPDGKRLLLRIDRGKWGDEPYVVDLSSRRIWFLQSGDGAFLLGQAYVLSSWKPADGIRVERGAAFDLDHDARLALAWEPDRSPARRLSIELNSVWSGEINLTVEGSGLSF